MNGYPAVVIHHPPGPQWRAMTIGIDDPGDLTAYLPPAGGHAWIRRGDGMVGIGEIARFEGGTAAEADEWWQDACGRIEQETELPGGARHRSDRLRIVRRSTPGTPAWPRS